MLCIVTGKVLQLFSYYSTHDGLPAREYVLAGHTSDVIATVRAPFFLVRTQHGRPRAFPLRTQHTRGMHGPTFPSTSQLTMALTHETSKWIRTIALKQVWAPDDLRLFSASKDAVMEWRVGSTTRVRESFLQCSGRFLGLSLTFDGTLLAPCLLPVEDNEDGGEQVREPDGTQNHRREARRDEQGGKAERHGITVERALT